MKKGLLFFFLMLFAQTIHADEEIFDLKAGRESGFLAPPPAVFSPKELSTFNPHLPKVNVITGEYCEEECDLIVAGIEPISYRRFYSHLGYKDEGYGHWKINPECLFLFNFETRDYPKYGAIGLENGSFSLYESGRGNVYTFDAQKNKSFTNGAEITGQTHPLNTQITYRRVDQDEFFCYWEGKVEDGNGRRRVFSSEEKWWPKGTTKYTASAKNGYVPPYQARILEERRPNGNIIRYDYENYNGEGDKYHPAYLPNYHVLKSIKAYSAQGFLLGMLHIDYKRLDSKRKGRRVDAIHINGSDGRIAYLFHKIREVKAEKKHRRFHGTGWTTWTDDAIYDTVLDHIDAAWKPTQYYDYRWERARRYFDAPFMCHTGERNGRGLDTHYNLGTKKVTSQNAPVGPNNEMVPVARYEYNDDHTISYDGENNKTIFRFNGEKRITSIEKFEENSLYSIEKYEWESITGNLQKKQIEDRTGNLLSRAEYLYDDRHNVIEEKLFGGEDVITRTFSRDGFNLKATESDRPGKFIAYAYVPGTNLPTSEIVYENGLIRKRSFHFYDDQIGCARTKTIIDDGKTLDPNDLTDVTYRHILEISPKKSMPCVGLPEEIKEKTIDQNGREILLKKVCYSYHPSGKITQEDHYDTSGTYCYSIKNEYDGNERLVSSTDPLGNKTTFKYDDNFNLIEQKGPKPDMLKVWVYDLANRPIEEKEWQTDGSVLVTRKKFDKASRLIAAIDECGFETRYEYDALGRIAAIYHPDGSVERKVYDPLGNLIQETDANGYVTRTEFNFRGQTTAIYRPDGSQEHYTYNKNGGTLASHIDPQGTQTIYCYDIFDRPTKTEVYSPNGELLKSITAKYSTCHKISETDGEGNITYYTYDFAGRKIGEEKSGKKTFYSYDLLGRLSKTQEGDAIYENIFDFKGQLITKKTWDLKGDLLEEEKYAYDGAGNRTHIINSKGASETIYNTRGLPLLRKDALEYATHLNYGYSNGFLKVEIDPLGIQTFYLHDSRGNEIEVIKKNTHGEEIQKVKRAFDRNKNLIQETHTVFEGVTPTKTIVHSWTYGPGDRIEKFVEAGEKETIYLYDNSGKLTQVVKPDRIALNSEYDLLSRLERYFSHDFDFKYAYDKNDQLISVYDSIGRLQTIRSYDPLGNVVKEELGNGLALSYSYDRHGRRDQIVYPDGSSTNYSYRGNRLYALNRKDLQYTYAERDLEGNPTITWLPNKLGVTYIERDSLSRWKKFASPFYSSIFSIDSYDPVGNLCQYKFQDSLGEKTCSFTYDDLRQLTSEDGHTYVHDSLHNRICKDDLQYKVNNLSEITHDGTHLYEYDPNGNLLFNGTLRFTYDSLDRLTSVQNGNSWAYYTYDPFHRRLSKTLVEKGRQTKKELYFYDGDNEIGSTDAQGNIQELRILGEGLGAEIGASVFVELKGKTYLPIHDHRGCLVTLADPQTRQAAETYRYSAFGEQLNSGMLSPWKFSSKRLDPETGFLFFGRRYYSPTIGRWITPDPQGFEDGPNLYAYLHNSPLSDFDLYGLWSWLSMWNTSKSFGCGVGKQVGSGLEGTGHVMGKMGEWMYADFQYEYFNDPSIFRSKSETATPGWKHLGRSIANDPLGSVAPGLMEAVRMPSDAPLSAKAEAWGKAAVDVALLGISVAKFGGSLANIGRAGRIGEKAATFGKIGNATSEAFKIDSLAINRGLFFESSITNVMGKSYQRVGEVATPIKNIELLKKLNFSSKGDWVKVYEAGMNNGSQVEIHYFRNNTTGQFFDVKKKYNHWHQKSFENLNK